MKKLLAIGFLLLSTFGAAQVSAEDGYEMWLRYQPVTDQSLLRDYRNQLRHLVVEGDSEIMQSAARELTMGLEGLLDRELSVGDELARRGSLVIGTPENSELIAGLDWDDRLAAQGPEGYLIETTRIGRRNVTVVASEGDAGVLYGSFHLLRKLQTQDAIDELAIASAPKVQHRVVNHWDNLNRLVERGYAGLSLWDWGTLPEYKENPRYHDYARVNASLGINGTAINNVNADPRILTEQFLEKVAALADVFRRYGITTYLSINYDSPRAFGDLDTADPLDPDVQQWWKDMADKVYEYIPDFGGFLVKADSEGQPGPHGYGRTHADGANMLAEAVEPHGGVIFWRAFVYDPEQEDRFREAYDEFMALDGQFKDNVIVQIKNGPIDFQPREPFSPLFGAMKSNIMLELQVTQEYFGFSYHLAYQGPLFEEVLQADTHAKGEGSTVGKILGGEVFDYTQTGMAGVINPGTDRNWTGHPFVQSSWYAFGRMAWDYELTSKEIADEWMRMTFTNDERFLDPVGEIMEESREAGVNYRNPLGLTHLYAQGHHYGPAPWYDYADRMDWTAWYYHRATEDGIGFDRTESGSNAVEQYHPPVRDKFADLDQIDEDFLLWFHHVGWNHEMESGRTLWEELVYKYDKGVQQVRDMQERWAMVEGVIDDQRFEQVRALLDIQLKDAIRWRDSSVSYFQSVNGLPLPEGSPEPEHSLEHYKLLEQSIYVPDPWHPKGDDRTIYKP